ncbi:hypothetical protein EXS62_00770 [Candidatus Kaiserbacteria bacterium]|nr:hypothetical protein [Candidatus Kaiserbacteria bacterium]
MVDDRKQGGEELHHHAEKPKGPLAAREEEVLEFWNKEKIFEQTLTKDAPKGEYVFYDGPPFANGLPHYGHILASTIKDAIPRYRTMQGYRVQRRWGWDCHGLPVENLVEKELGLKGKKDIEEYGIEKFNAAARVSIMKDVSDWKRIIPRLGRWADMDQDYKTMDPTYTESVWWAFKTLYDKKLIYEGFKSMHYCPRCGTTLSNFEVAQGYLDIDDVGVTVKLRLVDEPDTSLLIWTTTAWSLPGNNAAAVNPTFVYTKVKTDGGFVIAAEGKVEGEVVQRYKGTELVGKKYQAPFDYYPGERKVWAAEFVTAEDGTGIVHIAPAFGADDLALAQKHKISLIRHVTQEGKFAPEVKDFAGLPVKPKGNPRETDEKIAAWLQEKGLLFKQEKIKHSYPHCWRCDTPLLNWAANSWFVKVSDIKSKLLRENARVRWVPEHVGKGRFNNGLESAPDWAISRSRYWGAPLPVWRNQKTKELKVAGSVLDLLAMVRRSGNRYFVMRHGQAIYNTKDLTDHKGDPHNPLTETGRLQAAATAAELKSKSIDLIITSPLLRTRETAAIVARELGVPESAVMVDERLVEVDFGRFDGGPIQAYRDFYASFVERMDKGPEGGETYRVLRRRIGEFLFDIEQRYTGKNVLIVTHQGPAYQLIHIAKRASIAQTMSRVDNDDRYLRTAGMCEVPFTPYPHNRDYELDLHRPYIDDVAMGNSLDGEWVRVPDVFDCWFESGSMPFASNHYPFREGAFDPKGFLGFNKKGYPADFIAEGLDQTRGWFYSLMVLGTALFGRAPYKNVIVNGLIVAADGKKMSKSLKNYPDPMDVVEKYGADALRYYLLSSPLVKAEDLRFQEKGVDEVSKKLIMRLDNVRSFYDLFAPVQVAQKKVLGSPVSAKTHEAGRPDYFSEQPAPTHVLDRWILSRLAETVEASTKGFETYELDLAVRPLADFIDDLSTWYVRRSRDRFKTDGPDKDAALATLRYALRVLAQVMAPVMPFFAEDLYGRMRSASDPISVHLSVWPAPAPVDAALTLDMARVRSICSLGLQAREKAGIKIRQPLQKLIAKSAPKDAGLRTIIADEVNVKEVVEDQILQEEVVLDIELTAELKEEGTLREWVRAIQEWRKTSKLSMTDRPGLLIKTPDAEFIRAHRDALMGATGLISLETKEEEAVSFERL